MIDRDDAVPVTTFTAYGLMFATTIPLALPLPKTRVAAPPDVAVRRGPWEPDVSLPLVDEVTRASATRCTLDLTDAAGVRFDIRGGDTIIVDADDDADLGDLWLWLFGPAMSTLLYQRDVLPLHANAVVMPDGRAVAIAGDSGAGKSTLTAALLARGALMLTDDITAVDTTGSAPTVTGGIQQLKLWDSSASLLGLDLSEVPMVRPDLPKHAMDVTDRYATGPHLLASIHVLTPRTSGDELTVVRCSGMACFAPLQAHLSRHYLMAAIADRSRMFQRLTTIAGLVAVFDVQRRSDADTVTALVDHVLATHASTSET